MKTYTLFDHEKQERQKELRKRTKSLFKQPQVDHTATFLKIRATFQTYFGDLEQEHIEIKPAALDGYDFRVTGFEYSGLITIENVDGDDVINLFPDNMVLGPIYLSMLDKYLCRFCVNFTDGPGLGGALHWAWGYSEEEVTKWAAEFRRVQGYTFKKTLVGVAPYHKKYMASDPDSVISRKYML